MISRPEDVPEPEHRWTHDDNMKSQTLGWIIVPYIEHKELVSVQWGRTAYQIYNNEIKPQVESSSLHRKAYVTLAKEKFLNPNHTFAHEVEVTVIGRGYTI